MHRRMQCMRACEAPSSTPADERPPRPSPPATHDDGTNDTIVMTRRAFTAGVLPIPASTDVIALGGGVTGMMLATATR